MESCDEILLQGARNGDHAVVRDLLEARKQKKLSFNLDCKGRTKSNYGWTPLHLASYFGHEQVAEILLQNGAHVDVVNEAGDTPLHKASFTGREPLVMLLLRYNADVCIINGEGQLPKDVALHEDVRKLLEGAERADIRRKEQQLFQAAREGNLTLMNTLLHSTNPPNINCTDPSGNTALHCAAYREQKEAAVILLQNGIDSTICNNRGQTALQLAQSPQMKQILDVQPIKKLIKHATRFEGNLLKRSRFLGWQNVWVVLERGVLTYFKSRADSCSGVKRKGFKHLDEAKIVPMELEPNVIIVHFSDNTVHRLAVPLDSDENHLDVQKWINAFQEHVEYCTHYMSQGKRLDDSDDEQEMLPLGSMQDALQTAQAHQHILQNNISSLSFFLSDEKFKNSAFTDVYQCLKQVTENARLMMNSLQHCLTIFTQQEEIRHLQLKQEQEKCRVLEDALHVLAKEHHELEQSITSPFHTPKASRSPRFYDTSDDEFYDAFEGDSDDSVGPSKSTSFSSLSTLVADNSSESKSANGELLNDVVAKSNKNDQIEAKGTSGKLIPSQCLVSSRSAHMSSMDSLLSSGHYYSAVSDDSSSQISVPKAKKNISRHMMNEGRARSHKKQPKVPVSTWQGRSRLPVPMFARNDYSVWSILKQCIGKELTKITMPIIFNEPLSFLQRLTEYMEYAYLLNEASRGQDPIERLEYVAAFAISALASNWDRVGKPFNPLLGETYELERDDFRVICEQVSHHPPISAFHADSPNFVFHGSIVPKLKFWGKSVEVQPKGLITVELPGHDEMYTWHNVNCCVHNIIVGKLWIEQYGVLEIVNHKTGHKCVLNLKPAGWFSKDLHKVEGFIMDRKKKRLRYLYGKWTDLLKSVDIESYEEYMKSNPHRFKQTPSHEVNNSPRVTPTGSPAHTPKKSNKINSLLSFGSSSFSSSTPPPTADEPPNGYEGFNSNDGVPPDEIEEPPKNSSTFSLDIPNSATLWEATPRPPDCDKYYQFTLFSMTLNDMLPGMREKLAPTDSRFRPDIRKLEEGDIDGAAAEKNRLEEKQRDARKSRKKAKEKENWKPKWFKLSSNPHTKEDDWIYTGGYWERDYSTCPDIF